jgi:4-hydroxybenzoate polyprenyltransferase
VTAGVVSRAFARAYWVTLRPYLFPVSGTAGLVGLAVAPGLSPARLAVAFAAFFLAYGLGQALTDCFQTDTDALSSPYRPLVRGVVSRAQVLAVSLAGLGACGATLALLNPANLLPAGLGVLGLATYTPLKRRWWGGPPWNSWVVALLPVMGALCGGASLAAVLRLPTMVPAVASVFFTYAVFVVLGYFKDISADRATGYETVVVRFGWLAGVAVSACFGTAGVAASAALLARCGPLVRLRAASPSALVVVALWVGGVLLLGRAHLRMLRTRDEHRAHPAVADTVRGFVLLHLGEAVAIRPDLAVPAAVLAVVAELALRRRPEVEQI